MIVPAMHPEASSGDHVGGTDKPLMRGRSREDELLPSMVLATTRATWRRDADSSAAQFDV